MSNRDGSMGSQINGLVVVGQMYLRSIADNQG